MTAGDLGITAAEVEKTLGSVLELCQTWDALVLIDEADVFLEARNSSEIQRNALVCVMLRLLEYYTGCLFLSSNRAAGSIDCGHCITHYRHVRLAPIWMWMGVPRYGGIY